MTNEKEREAFLAFLQEQNFYKQNLQLLQWDSHTNIPSKGNEQRAEVIGYFSEKLHQLQTSEQMEAYIDRYLCSEDEFLQALAYECKTVYERAKKIPSKLQKAYSMEISKAEAVWRTAKEQSNYELFKPALKKMIHLTREIADCLGDKNHRYDTLLQQWEPGMTTATLDEIFPPLRKALIELLGKIKASGQVIDRSVIRQSFPIKQQEALCMQLLTNIGFDHEAGRLDTSAHPFTFGLHAQDVRITTWYDEHDFSQSIFGVLHEGGHALYEQGFASKLMNTPLAEASSMGMHESQALLWEILVGRSQAFWHANLSTLKKHAPESFQKLSAEQLYNSLHFVNPSFVRVDADEVTYSLHIMLRYEIEKLLISGELTVDELPKVWNEKMEEYLGIKPKNDQEGVLQDIHWASGYFGYFPTYTLGFMYAAQIFQTMEKDINATSLIEANRLTDIKDWLTTSMYEKGKQQDPLQLIKELTNEPLRSDYLVDYLTKKYQAIYKFE